MDKYLEIVREMAKNSIPLEYPYDTMIELIGIDNTIKIIDEFGGSQIYFPGLKKVSMDYVKAKIIEEFNGYNYSELAKKYNVSQRYIYKVVEKPDTKDSLKKVK